MVNLNENKLFTPEAKIKIKDLISEVRTFKLEELGAFGFRHLPSSEVWPCGKPCSNFCLKDLIFY